MRYLPYVLLAFMLAPIAIWLVIDALVVGGDTTRFNGEQSYVLYTLVPLTVIAFTLLMRWSSKHIKATQAKA